MIFVTVGSQMPFDRLISAIDEWAGRNPGHDVYAQIGNSTLRPRHMRFTGVMTPAEFSQALRDAQLIVGHAGMGTIITALELGKQLVVMPRLGSLHETRNDHQVATARHFGTQGRVIVAADEAELPGKLDYAITLNGSAPIESQASPRLLATIRAFLGENAARPESVQLFGDNPSEHAFTSASTTLSDNLHVVRQSPRRSA
jgi:UDP-N-acetylglucosamine transferase subunit ALG13